MSIQETEYTVALRHLSAFTSALMIDDLQGLAVFRDSIIVSEAYAADAGPEPDRNLHVMSVTKSITSTLIGIAIDRGFIESPDQLLSEFLGEEMALANQALSRVTIHQLLTMTAGQDWKELGRTSEFSVWVNADDQIQYIIDKPVINTPGTVFNYSDGSAHLVSAILSNATGMNASSFAEKYLFGPMGIGSRDWSADNRGFSYGGVRLYLGIHDMIEIGRLHLAEGRYNGRQIVSSDWIKEATRIHVSAGDAVPFLTDYGYFWWVGQAHGNDFICANGYGGQFIFVVNELNLVVCSRCNYSGLKRTEAGDNWYRILNIIINQILPAEIEFNS